MKIAVRARAVLAALLLAMVAIYYLDGLRFQVWADSAGYLAQALGLVGEAPYARPGNRQLGYPLLVALALETPAPLLILVLLQACIAALSFVAVHWILTRGVLPAMSLPTQRQESARAAILIFVGIATLYSIVHVQIAAVLTENLFSGLALAGVLATIWYARLEPGARRPRIGAAIVATVISLNLIVKPHWLIAAALLASIVAFQLWRMTADPGESRTRQAGGLAMAIVIPFAALFALTVPDHLLGEKFSPRDAHLFGPRAVFCNHLHLVSATLQRRPGMTLQSDAEFEEKLRTYFLEVQRRPDSGWRRLGFNGDLCTYDARLSALLDARFPQPRAQAEFLLGAVGRSALADPLPYAVKVLRHISYGFTTAFEKFAHHARPGRETFAHLQASPGVPAGIDTGIRQADSIGPLGSEDVLKRSVTGWVVHGILAVVFFGMTGVLCGLAVGMVVAVPVAWRTWSGPTRRDYLTFVAIPLLALGAHHLLVALTHSFDIWRYAFNMYFVNLLFIGTATLFAQRHFSWPAWLRRPGVWRSAPDTIAPRAPRPHQGV